MTKVRDSIIIKNGSPEIIYVCPGEHCNIGFSTHIPVVNTYEEAFKLGWVKTNNKKFCPPNESFVLLCPECAEKELY